MSTAKASKPDVNEDQIVFFCKPCQKTVAVSQVGKKYVYKCKECEKTDVAFGTLRSVQEYYVRRHKKN